MKISDFAARLIFVAIFFAGFRLMLDAPSYAAIGFALLLCYTIVPTRDTTAPTLKVVRCWYTSKPPMPGDIEPPGENDLWWDMNTGKNWQFRNGQWVPQP